ncbi:hypothetical protein DL96DRAFT_1556407 [Flagelloscypha sp. PMI_526]|nr:hypothetical protein DL96DRAFT_1556407 [Flagelloscypha sp. PMI_526]
MWSVLSKLSTLSLPNTAASVLLKAPTLLPSTFLASIGPSIGPSLATVSGKDGDYDGPRLLDFSTGWQSNSPIRSWYEQECTHGSTAVERLEFRKDRAGPWFHGFVVVFTKSGRIYRIDRRPHVVDNPEDDLMAFIKASGCRALDTIVRLREDDYEAARRTSDSIVDLQFHHTRTRSESEKCHSIYLLHILSTCFAVKDDPLTKQYTLQRYNCYYLAWILIMISVRWVSDWETRFLLSLSSCPELSAEEEDDDDDAHSVRTVSGKFYPRSAWQEELLSGWSGFYKELIDSQGMVSRDATWVRRRQALNSMVDHVLRRALETAPITYPTLWVHPRVLLRDLGRSFAENMPSSFNSQVAKLARDPQMLANMTPVRALADEGKSLVRVLLMEDRMLDPTCLMLLPGEFISWLTSTPPTSESDPPPNLPISLRVSSAKHSLFQDSLQSTPSFTPSYGAIYSALTPHIFSLPVIDQEAEIHIGSLDTLSTPLELETFMHDCVTAHAARVHSWGLAGRDENVNDDIIDKMKGVWDTVRKQFPKALVSRWI